MTAAVIAAALAVGAWWGIRRERESHRLDTELAHLLLTTPLEER